VTLEGLSSLFHFVAKIPADFNYLIFFEVTNDLEKGKPPKKKKIQKNSIKIARFLDKLQLG